MQVISIGEAVKRIESCVDDDSPMGWTSIYVTPDFEEGEDNTPYVHLAFKDGAYLGQRGLGCVPIEGLFAPYIGVKRDYTNLFNIAQLIVTDMKNNKWSEEGLSINYKS